MGGKKELNRYMDGEKLLLFILVEEECREIINKTIDRFRSYCIYFREIFLVVHFLRKILIYVYML